MTQSLFKAENETLPEKLLRILPHLPPDTYEKYFQMEENAIAFLLIEDMELCPPGIARTEGVD